MRNKKITICNVNVHPGESANLALPLPEQYSCSPLFMPIKVIHGKTAGPCLVLFSGLKGTELNGLEIANRLTKLLSPNKISGTIISIPVMNVYGLTHYPASMPNGNDLSDCFPGLESGSYGERLAYLVTTEILKKANYCVELQTGDLNHNILPQIYCDFTNTEAKNLAKLFNAPVVTSLSVKENNLIETLESLQIPTLIYQAGEAMRFDENAISLGVNGMQNIMRAINILAKEPSQELQPIFSKDEKWIVSHKGGILHHNISLGQIIEKGELIGNISDPFGADIIEPIKSLRKGIVVGVNTAPLIHEGLPLIKIASFIDYDKAETIIEQWDKNQPDSFIN